MMALLNVIGRRVYYQKNSKFMSIYRNLKFKMKLGYECWKQDCKFSDLVVEAISKTIEEI